MIGGRRSFLALVIAGVMVGVGSIALLVARAHRQDRACQDNLTRIYSAVMEYANETGNLPELALYPEDLTSDDDSLLVILGRYGVAGGDLLCPATDETLRLTGNTYLWNTRLSGKPLSEIEATQWMMVEINALSAQVPAPHHGHYHVLYTDGEIREEENPPAVL